MTTPPHVDVIDTGVWAWTTLGFDRIEHTAPFTDQSVATFRIGNTTTDVEYRPPPQGIRRRDNTDEIIVDTKTGGTITVRKTYLANAIRPNIDPPGNVAPPVRSKPLSKAAERALERYSHAVPPLLDRDREPISWPEYIRGGAKSGARAVAGVAGAVALIPVDLAFKGAGGVPIAAGVLAGGITTFATKQAGEFVGGYGPVSKAVGDNIASYGADAGHAIESMVAGTGRKIWNASDGIAKSVKSLVFGGNGVPAPQLKIEWGTIDNDRPTEPRVAPAELPPTITANPYYPVLRTPYITVGNPSLCPDLYLTGTDGEASPVLLPNFAISMFAVYASMMKRGGNQFLVFDFDATPGEVWKADPTSAMRGKLTLKVRDTLIDAIDYITLMMAASSSAPPQEFKLLYDNSVPGYTRKEVLRSLTKWKARLVVEKSKEEGTVGLLYPIKVTLTTNPPKIVDPTRNKKGVRPPDFHPGRHFLDKLASNKNQ
jgi:hypothetical protein